MAGLVTITVPYVNIFLMGSFHGSFTQIICIAQDAERRWMRTTQKIVGKALKALDGDDT